MQVEHVARIGLSAGGAFQQQAQGSIGHGVLGQIVVNHQRVPAAVHEIFRHGAARVGGDVLQRRGIAGRGRHDHRVFHGSRLLQNADHLRHGAGLLADGHIDADGVLPLLVQDGIHGDGGFAGLPVANEQFALTAADGEHGINGQNARFQGPADGFALHNARGRPLDGIIFLGRELLAPVDDLAQGIDHPAQNVVVDGDASRAAGAHHPVPFGNIAVLAEEHDTGGAVGANVLHHALYAAVEQHDFPVLHVIKAFDHGDAVAYGPNQAHLLVSVIQFEILNVLFQKGNDPGGIVFLLKGLEGFAQLANAAQGAPIVVIVAYENIEAAHHGGIPANDEFHLLHVVFFPNHLANLLQLFLCRRGNAGDFHLQRGLRALPQQFKRIVVVFHCGFLSSGVSCLPMRIKASYSSRSRSGVTVSLSSF